MWFDFNRTSEQENFGIDSFTETAAKEPCVWQTEKIARRELTRAHDSGINFGALASGIAIVAAAGINYLTDYLRYRKKKDD